MSNLSFFGVYGWPLSEFNWKEEVRSGDVLSTAYRDGIRFLDTGPVVGSELSSNGSYAKFFRDGQRGDVTLSVKLGFGMNRNGDSPFVFEPEALTDQLEATLEQFDRNRADLAFLPFVPGLNHDEAFDEAFEVLRSSHLVDSLGVVLQSPDKLDPDRLPEVSYLQVPFNLFDYARHGDDGLRNCLKQYEVICYDPLAGGLLSQHYADVNEEILDHEVREHHPKFSTNRVKYIRCLRDFQEYFLEKGRDELQIQSIGLSWLLHRYDFDTILVGLLNANDVANLKSATRLDLSDDDLDWLEGHARETTKGVEAPHFVLPPPALPRHSYERHLVSRTE